MKTIIMKFGGTSVGSESAIRQAAAIVDQARQEGNRMIVVVSAMRGVTDLLLQSAQAALVQDQDTVQNIISRIRNQHQSVWENLFPQDEQHYQNLDTYLEQVLSELVNICHSISVMGEVTNRGLDLISSFGERINARAFTAFLVGLGIPAQSVDSNHLIVSDNNFQNAVPLRLPTREQCQQILIPLLADEVIPVITGFFAASEEGAITTLGRGGSDYSASILGDAIDCDEIWIWTDVDGVMTADPRIVPKARVIPEISFAEIGEMAYFGAKVLHPRTIRPAVERNIPLFVKNTFNPGFPGTKILHEVARRKGTVTAVSSIHDLSLVTIAGRGMLGVPGIAARTFSAVAREKTSVLMISQSSSEQSICFVIPDQSTAAIQQSLEIEFTAELARKDIDSISFRNRMVIITVTGVGMSETPGVAGRIFTALGKSGINVIAIAQGSSEYSISMLVETDDSQEAIRRVHAEVIETQEAD